MTDDHTPQSDLIDDAIRQAERQLEEKLDALRMSALGDAPDTRVEDAPDDVAVLRPTGAVRSSSDDTPALGDVHLREELPRDNQRDNPRDNEDSADGGVTGLTAEWETPARESSPSHASWDDDRAHGASSASALPSHGVEAAPTEEEMQFWAHTRTALRNLQQVSESLPGKVSGSIGNEIERIMRDEMSTSNATMRLLQQNVQQTLPTVADRLEEALREELSAPTSLMLQVQEEMPARLDRFARDVRGTVSEEIERLLTAVRASMQDDLGAVEQSVASNVSRMSSDLTESMGRVERSMSGVDQHLDGVDRTVRTEVTRVERHVSEQLQSMAQQVQTNTRDVSDVLTSMAETNRILLERVSSVAGNLDQDRTRRAEDLEFLVDTITTGWEGMASAVKTLYEQGSKTDSRLQSLEQQFERMQDLERSIESTMQQMTTHIQELQPAPVVVTVNHPDAQVANTTSAGFIRSGE